MPRPNRPRVDEKPHNFFSAMKRLFSNLKKFKIVMVIAIMLAITSAILSLIAPNKLSDFADEISKGLIPETTKLEEVVTKMYANFNEQKISLIVTSSQISREDYNKFTEVIPKLKSSSNNEKISIINELPDSIFYYFLTDITIDDNLIKVEDQIKFIRLSDKYTGTDLINKLPDSIYKVIEPSMNMKKIKNIAIVMATLYILSSLFGFIENYLMTTVSNKYAYGLRKNISNKINKLPLKYFDNHETGDILSRVTNDVDTISQNLNNSLSSLISNLTLFLGSIIMMFITNWIMALTAIISSAIGFFLTFKILNKSQNYFAAAQKSLGNLNGYIEEIYSGQSVVKAYNAMDDATDEFEKLNNDLYEAKRKSIFLSGTMQPLMGFIGNLGYVAVCVVGALLAQNNIITFGVIVAFMIYIRLFTNPMSQIAQNLTSLQSTAAAAERVFEFMDEKELSDESKLTKRLNKNEVKGNIEFKNVKFGYNENKTIINNFSAKAKAGEKIAIVGPTGAGKTTMVNLLMKFYEINEGDILIDGVSIHDLTRENIHELFCMVLQDTWLFDGTIRDNIKYNNENVTDEEIMEVCNKVGVSHFIKTLPKKLDSNVTDSDTISSGQKQLFTIARGMLENAPFLILDEATSNVDTRTEELVQKAMDKLMKGRTSFIIAHRLSTIKNADLILVMKDGNIIETGNHEELLKQNGFYAELYNSQFSNK